MDEDSEMPGCLTEGVDYDVRTPASDPIDPHAETIASFVFGGETYEIDHLGINSTSQWGVFAIYRDSKQIVDFAIPESVLKPELRPAELPVTTEELVFQARDALKTDKAADATGND